MNARLLLLATAAFALYGVGQIWLVQLSSYPLWRYVGPREFETYHLAWWRSIWGAVLAPAALVFIGAILMIWWRAPGIPDWAIWLGLALQIALIAGTAAWWGPLMARLSGPAGELLQVRYRLLMRTHWIRVAIVTAYGILLLWMLASSG